MKRLNPKSLSLFFCAMSIILLSCEKNDHEDGITSGSSKNDSNYVDLGLSSGTLWKKNNESGMYSFDDAMIKWNNNIPTSAQWNELNLYCKWTWEGNGYKITGYNGNSIFLPTAGGTLAGTTYGSSGSSSATNNEGLYWSSSAIDASYASVFHITSYEHTSGFVNRPFKQCIRLIKK